MTDMPAARPSAAAVENVLRALKAQGLIPAAVKVAADGGFVVETRVDDAEGAGASSPPRWGQR